MYNMEVEPYYSSDEELAWGPLTLKEIKDEFKKEPKKIKRRETDFAQYTFYSCDLSQNEKSAEPGTSGYFTPNDSLIDAKSNKNNVFLEKLAKAIDGEGEVQTCSESSYVTAPEMTHLDVATDDTMMKILGSEKFENLENIQQTLIENTVYVSSDESCDEALESSGEAILISDSEGSELEEDGVGMCLIKEEPCSNSLNSCNSSLKLTENECKQPSDESTNDSELNDSFKLDISEEQLVNASTSHLQDLEIEDYHDKASNDSIDNLNVQDQEVDEKQHDQISDKSTNHLQYLEDADKKYDRLAEESSDSLENDLVSDDSADTSKLQVIEEEYDPPTEENTEPHEMNLSGVRRLSAPSSTLSSQGDYEACRSMSSGKFCNESYNYNPSSTTTTDSDLNKDDSYAFNDTLEEMEMALKRGLDYVMPEDEVKIKIEAPSPLKIIPPQTPKTETVRKLPKSQNKKFDYVQSPIGDYIRRKSPNNDNFKLPLKPIKNRQTPNKQPQTKLFKNVVSPIGVYIKNSPGVCLKQNVLAKTVPRLHNIESSPAPKSNKENSGIPQVIYKPAKTVVAATRRDIILPPSIQKLVQEPVVIQHDKRIKGGHESSISRKLLEEDLTTTSSDFSLLNQSAIDVSFITNKQAFIK